MPGFKKFIVAIIISMSFFFSDVVFAEQSEISKENKASSATSSRVMKIVAEKYSKVVQIYEAVPTFSQNTKMEIGTDEKSPEVAGVLVIEFEQRAVLFSSNAKPESVTSEKSKRKPGHTHEENERHEIEKLGPEEEES